VNALRKNKKGAEAPLLLPLDFSFVKGEQTIDACPAHCAFELLPSEKTSSEFPVRPALATFLRTRVKSVKWKLGVCPQKKLGAVRAAPRAPSIIRGQSMRLRSRCLFKVSAEPEVLIGSKRPCRRTVLAHILPEAMRIQARQEEN
jgi:hypothetical protein